MYNKFDVIVNILLKIIEGPNISNEGSPPSSTESLKCHLYCSVVYVTVLHINLNLILYINLFAYTRIIDIDFSR